MPRITFENKEALEVNENVEDYNKIKDSDINSLKKAINQNSSYTVLTPGASDGYFYTGQQGTLETGMIYNVKFPTISSSINQVYLSVDNGNVYNPVSGTVTNLSGKYMTLYWDGTNFVNNIYKNVYSTGEMKTNEVWIDGKPIYQIVYVHYHSANHADWTNFASMPANYDSVISIYGIVKESGGNIKPTPHYETDNRLELYLVFADTKMLANISVGYVGGTSTVIVKYTKTTD